jgi:hypothetical protein
MPINNRNPEKTKITFGIHKNKTVEWLYANQKSYLDFILSQDSFKKYDYYHIFKKYKPAEDHVNYCNKNGIKFCEHCCKKKKLRKFDLGDNFHYCGVCYNGARRFERSSLLEDTSEYGMKTKQKIKDTIDKKQQAEYKKYLKNLNK